MNVKNLLVKNNNTDLIYCKYYKLKSVYEYTCKSILFRIYSAYPCRYKFINRDKLIHQCILFDTNSIYDENEIIIQDIQHYY